MTQNMDCYISVISDVTEVAGKLIKEKIWQVKNVKTKSSAVDFVTETDQEVEKLLISTISSHFPDHKFIAEESSADGAKVELTDAPTWIIDPIDGTMNFVHGYPHVCISIGLVINKVIEYGIIYNPVLEQRFTAEKGKGAFYNCRQINVSDTKEIANALLAMEFGSSRDPEKIRVVTENMKILYPKAHGIRSLGSAALNMANVAFGGVDAYLEAGISAWDMAAGALIVQEAGGVVIDTTGNPFDLMSGKVLCAGTKELADELTSVICQYNPQRD